MLKFAVFGNPIAHSLSPTIHQMFARDCDLTISYEKRLAQIGQFNEEVTRFFADDEVIGCNVTVPFKLDAYQLAVVEDKAAQLAGAVNTLFRREGKLFGYNTDGIGLVNDLLNQEVTLAGAHVLLLGAGGAARGVIHPLLEAGVASLTICNRTEQKAQVLVEQASDERVSATSYASLEGENFDLVINSTSSSLSDEKLPVPNQLLAQTKAVYDMVYSKSLTPFLLQAEAAGTAKLLDGLGMLVEQAAAAFTIWTGQRPDTNAVLQYMREQLNEK